jgi:hypothetical protein
MATIDINRLIQESITAVQSGTQTVLKESEDINTSLRSAVFESDDTVQDSSIVGVIGMGFGAYKALQK